MLSFSTDFAAKTERHSTQCPLRTKQGYTVSSYSAYRLHNNGFSQKACSVRYFVVSV